MKFSFDTTLAALSFSGAQFQGSDLGSGTIDYKTSTGHGLQKLALFFGKVGAVRVTFEADEPVAPAPVAPAPVAPEHDTDASHGTLVPHPANVMAAMAARDERLCSCPATSEYDPPCPTHGVLGIGVTGQATAPAPPLVNGRPSCCREWDKRDDVLWIRGQWIIGTIGVHASVRFCPFCGAKLPEVPR